MAVKGSATVTLSQYRDTESVTRYYKLQSSSLAAPDKPANVKPNETPAGWAKAEPACDITKTLYTCDVTVFSDKTTYVSDVSKSTSYEAAIEAWNKAQTAQNTATEAAKTADNYISTDSTGIMVSENKGTTKETPSNATKNNVLITEKDVQIRKGKKVVASYGETTIIGSKDGNHMSISPYEVQIKSGGAEIFNIQTVCGSLVNAYRAEFDGPAVAQKVQNSETYTMAYPLGEEAIEVTKVAIFNKHTGETDYDIHVDNSKSWIRYELNTDSVTITIDGSNAEAKTVPWANYYVIIINYVPLKQYDSTVECDNLSARRNLSAVKNISSESADVSGMLTTGAIYVEGIRGSIAYQDGAGNRADLLRVTSGTGTITLTTGAVSFQPRWWRCGNIVQMEVGTKCTGAVASGANIAAGKITGVPAPITESGVRAVSYYGNNANISYMGSDGTFYARNAGADALAKNNDCIGGFTYITDGTRL